MHKDIREMILFLIIGPPPSSSRIDLRICYYFRMEMRERKRRIERIDGEKRGNWYLINQGLLLNGNSRSQTPPDPILVLNQIECLILKALELYMQAQDPPLLKTGKQQARTQAKEFKSN